MSDFAQQLDRHLTEPDNGYHDWLEAVYEKLHESEIDGDSVPDSWFNYLSLKEYSPDGAAYIIAKSLKTGK